MFRILIACQRVCDHVLPGFSLNLIWEGLQRKGRGGLAWSALGWTLLCRIFLQCPGLSWYNVAWHA